MNSGIGFMVEVLGFWLTLSHSFGCFVCSLRSVWSYLWLVSLMVGRMTER